MSSLPIDDRIAFEASYTAVTTPLPSNPSGLDESQVHEFLMGCSDSRATRQIQKWAANNDIDALSHVLTSAWRKRDRSNFERPELTYAVAHMLVDGGENVAFAQAWMEVFGHTVEMARKHLADQWRDTIEDRFLDQTRLGLATVANVFTILSYDEERVAPILQIMGYRADNYGMNDKQAQGLAHILRFTAPEGIPNVSYMVPGNGQVLRAPLTDVLFTYQDLKVRHMLPAVQLAYDDEREDIREVMRAGIQKMLNAGRLSMEAWKEEAYQWNAMRAWGEEGLGAKIWHATVLPKMPFVQALFEKCSDDIIISRLEQVEQMGADLQSPVRLKAAAEDQRVRILDIAAAYAKPDIVGWLLGKGCDPTLESTDPATGQSVNAQMLAAAKLAQTSESSAEYPAVRRVSELIAADLARRAALEAIADMNPEPQGRAAP